MSRSQTEPPLLRTAALAAALSLLAGCRSTAAARSSDTPAGSSLPTVGTTSSIASPTPAAPVSTARPGATRTQTVSTLVQQLDICIHHHGAPNFPDPYVDAAGKVAFPDSAPDLPTDAQAACQHIIDQLPNPGNAGPTAISGSEYQRWLQFAVCMRSHGLPAWPDPKSDGSFPLPASLRGSTSSGIAPAFEACRSLDPNPDGKWTVSQAGS
jgi:hypothetical protein